MTARKIGGVKLILCSSFFVTDTNLARKVNFPFVPFSLKLSSNIDRINFISIIKYILKVQLITGHEGPEGEQKYSHTLPSTSALDGGGWSTPRPGRFTPG